MIVETCLIHYNEGMKDKNGIERGNRIRWHADPLTYLHLVKTSCVVCEEPIDPNKYEENGNFCLKCCAYSQKQSHLRLWEKKDREGVDRLIVRH